MFLVMKLVRGRARKHLLIPIGCAFPFRFLKCCFPESSSCVRSPLSFFFSWPLWNKRSQRRNGHTAVLSGPTYILLQGQEEKRCLLCFHRSARQSGYVHSCAAPLRPFLLSSRALGWARRRPCVVSTLHSTQERLPLAQPFFTG